MVVVAIGATGVVCVAKVNWSLLAFNRGLVSPLALARVDLQRLALSAVEFVNWMPRSLGSMMLRPGTQRIINTRNNARAEYIPFMFSVTDKAHIEITDGYMRVLIDDQLVERPAVTTTITNGTFDTDLTGWTDSDETSTTSEWETGGYMKLTGNGTNAAIRKQTLTIASDSQNVEHALNITIARGTVLLRVGSTDGGDEYIAETTLYPGNHSLTFTPTGANVYLRILNRNQYSGLVESVTIDSEGIMEIPVPWTESDLDYLRHAQSGDVIFVACKGKRQRRIERRSTRSWSCVEYLADDGPFRLINAGPATIAASAISGDVTLTASQPLFQQSHVGALFRLTSTGQQVSAAVAAGNVWSDPIRVTGTGNGRIFAIVISGTWTGTVTLQRSVEEPGAWTDVNNYTNNTSTTLNDALTNQIIYYRIGIKTGNYTDGTANVQLTYSAGSISGVVRVYEYTSPTSAKAQVLSNLGGTAATADWQEGAWSDRRGWPSAVALHEGRLWWAGKDRLWGSESDAYSDFDENTEGDAGPIARSIGSGPVDTINWLMSVQRLIIGGEGAEFTAQSSSIDEPLSPTNFNIKAVSTQGSKAVSAVRLDNSAMFVQRGGARVYEMTQQDQFSGYETKDVTAVIPEIGKPGVVRIGVQRQPDTRIHNIRSDGTVAILVYDESEGVRCWVEFETLGEVESMVVMPGNVEDDVYYVVKRVVNGETKRFLEKWAMEDDCQGGTANKQADCFVHYSGDPATQIDVDHLEGETVVVWADGKYVGDHVVTGGQITLGTAAEEVIAGLPYTAWFKSTKLQAIDQGGTPLNQPKRIDHLGVILYNTHHLGLQYGADADYLDDLPQMEKGAVVANDSIYGAYDEISFAFNGNWSTDSRLCLRAEAPKPCTILAATVTYSQHTKA